MRQLVDQTAAMPVASTEDVLQSAAGSIVPTMAVVSRGANSPVQSTNPAPLHVKDAMLSPPSHEGVGAAQHEDIVLQHRQEQMPVSSGHQAQVGEQSPADYQAVPMEVEEELAEPQRQSASNQQHTAFASATQSRPEKTWIKAVAEESTAHLPRAASTEHIIEEGGLPGSSPQAVAHTASAPKPAAEAAPQLPQGVPQTADAVTVHDDPMDMPHEAVDPVLSKLPLAEEKSAEQEASPKELSHQ